MVVASSTEIRYVARVSDAEAEQLRDLHRGASRVHKSLPADHPRRHQSRELSELLARLHRRGVPIDVLADIVGISHQAVRARVTATEFPAAEFSLTASGVRLISHDAARAEDGVFVADAGMHRRLLVYPNPSAIPHLRMLTSVPFLDTEEQITAWLESESAEIAGAAPSSTKLRTPPAVYVRQSLVGKLMVELTPASKTV